MCHDHNMVNIILLLLLLQKKISYMVSKMVNHCADVLLSLSNYLPPTVNVMQFGSFV